MIKYNSHYIIAGLEDFQPIKVSTNLWLEASLFNIYKYLFRLGRKNGEPITKDLQKAVNNCEFFLSETLKHHFLSFQGGEFLQNKFENGEFLQTKTPEDKITEYLEKWQKSIKECKEFEEPELVSHFVETIVVYFYCYTNKKEKIQYLQASKIETYSNGAEFMQKRMEALKSRIENALYGLTTIRMDRAKRFKDNIEDPFQIKEMQIIFGLYTNKKTNQDMPYQKYVDINDEFNKK